MISVCFLTAGKAFALVWVVSGAVVAGRYVGSITAPSVLYAVLSLDPGLA